MILTSYVTLSYCLVFILPLVLPPILTSYITTTQTSIIQVKQDQPMRKQTYKTPLTKQDINENRQSISAPPYRTGMLIGDTSRQHYSRERTQAGHIRRVAFNAFDIKRDNL
jgi:hypothetical protein